MNKKSIAAFIITSLLLLLSIAANWILYQRGRQYYLQLNETRLDPFNINAYPINSTESESSLIVFVGDSRAAEWVFPAQVGGMTVVNRGYGAQTTAQILGRFPAHVTSLQPKIVVLQAGINDLKTIPLFPERKEAIIRDCKVNLEKMVNQSTEAGALVVLTTIFPLGEISIERSLFWSDDVALAIADVNAFLETLASDQVRVFRSDSVLANSDGIVSPAYSRDFLHLNAAGYQALNESLMDVLPSISN